MSIVFLFVVRLLCKKEKSVRLATGNRTLDVYYGRATTRVAFHFFNFFHSKALPFLIHRDNHHIAYNNVAHY